MMDTITLEKTGYRVSGKAYVTFWDGGKGFVEMKPYLIEKLTITEILKGVNDNGFGVASIDGADCWVDEVYGNSYYTSLGYAYFEKDKLVNSDIQKLKEA